MQFTETETQQLRQAGFWRTMVNDTAAWELDEVAIVKTTTGFDIYNFVEYDCEFDFDSSHVTLSAAIAKAI